MSSQGVKRKSYNDVDDVDRRSSDSSDNECSVLPRKPVLKLKKKKEADKKDSKREKPTEPAPTKPTKVVVAPEVIKEKPDMHRGADAIAGKKEKHGMRPEGSALPSGPIKEEKPEILKEDPLISLLGEQTGGYWTPVFSISADSKTTGTGNSYQGKSKLVCVLEGFLDGPEASEMEDQQKMLLSEQFYDPLRKKEFMDHFMKRARSIQKMANRNVNVNDEGTGDEAVEQKAWEFCYEGGNKCISPGKIRLQFHMSESKKEVEAKSVVTQDDLDKWAEEGIDIEPIPVVNSKGENVRANQTILEQINDADILKPGKKVRAAVKFRCYNFFPNGKYGVVADIIRVMLVDLPQDPIVL